MYRHVSILFDMGHSAGHNQKKCITLRHPRGKSIMPIQVTCGECNKRLTVKDEYAGKRVRCPGCQESLRIPVVEAADDWEIDEFEEPQPSALPARTRRRASAEAKSARRPKAASVPVGWKAKLKAQWHWATAAVVLVLAFLFPKAGLIIAALVMVAGIVMVLIGGLTPLLMIIAKDPGTVLLLIVSRSARFDMMRQPDDHPYKQLLRNTGKGFSKWLWKGLLLIVTFIPAAVLSSNSPMGKAAPAAAPEHPFGPGMNRPGFVQPGMQGPGEVPVHNRPGVDPAAGGGFRRPDLQEGRPAGHGPRGFQPQG